MKVLIADDDRVFTELISSRLRAQGHRALAAADAMQAFMFAMREKPDVIVLDVSMPGGTGFDALQKLKSSVKTGPIPVIVVSGLDDARLPQLALEHGASEFLRKPVTFEQLNIAFARIFGPSAA